jgi:ribosomal-protein-serine acetyltransferase
LRLIEERHGPELFAAVDRDRPYLREWLAWVDATHSVDDTLAFIRASLEAFANNQSITAGIWFHGELAGVIGTHRIDWLNRKTEIGYWLAQRFQRNGVMTDSCRALITHLFRERGLHRVECLCATGNARSCAIPQRLGFTREATLRQAQWLDGRYHDLYLWSVLQSEWKL